MEKLESSIPGLEPFSERNDAFKTPYAFLEGRKKVDGAEGLWRIRNSLYDLEKFAKFHPGGEEWIRLTKGTDITELFESHHLTDKALNLLPKYYIKDAVTPRSVPLTFEPNGFFCTFKKRALEALKDVNFHEPSKKTNLIADFLVSTTILLSLIGVCVQSYLIVIAAGIFLAWTAIIAHNYFHMRDNFRMYYFDLCTMSSKEWRITHVMSHHTYPNTIWDYEIYAAEPFFQWLPYTKKSAVKSFISLLLVPVFWGLLIYEQTVKREVRLPEGEQNFDGIFILSYCSGLGIRLRVGLAKIGRDRLESHLLRGDWRREDAIGRRIFFNETGQEILEPMCINIFQNISCE